MRNYSSATKVRSRHHILRLYTGILLHFFVRFFRTTLFLALFAIAMAQSPRVADTFIVTAVGDTMLGEFVLSFL